MKICQNCGTKNSKEAVFCENCGSKLPEVVVTGNIKKCRNCGHSNEEESTFCENCGSKLTEPISPVETDDDMDSEEKQDEQTEELGESEISTNETTDDQEITKTDE